MKNRIEKGIEDYYKKCNSWKRNEGALYPLDLVHVIDCAEYKTPAEIAHNGLIAGFMIGYRKGLKDARKGARK